MPIQCADAFFDGLAELTLVDGVGSSWKGRRLQFGSTSEEKVHMSTDLVPTFPPQAWAHRQRKIEMRPLTPSEWGPEALSARAQIADAYSRYAVGHDEARSDVVGSCFTQDAVFEVSHGQAEPFMTLNGRGAICGHVDSVTGRQHDQRRHLIANVLIEALDLEAGTASSLAECIVCVAADGLSVGCSVIYTANSLREEDGCWRFSYFFIGMDTYVGFDALRNRS
ncbi:MAG: nuclear transport factor 2 family protein [Acidimicrobiales bacterium]